MFGSRNREALARAQQENAHLRAELQRLGAMDLVQVRNKQQIGDMVKNRTAATGSQSFTYNNAEADICVRVLKAGNLESAIKRPETSVRVIQRRSGSTRLSCGKNGLR